MLGFRAHDHADAAKIIDEQIQRRRAGGFGQFNFVAVQPIADEGCADGFAVDHDDGVILRRFQFEFALQTVRESFPVKDEAVILIEVFHRNCLGGNQRRFARQGLEQRFALFQFDGGNFNHRRFGGRRGRIYFQPRSQQGSQRIKFLRRATGFVNWRVVIVTRLHGQIKIAAVVEAVIRPAEKNVKAEGITVVEQDTSPSW